MARVKGTLQITGGVKGLSFYTIQGGDTVYVRTKGGPSAKRMKTGKEFELVRKHQNEWAACVKFSRTLKNVVGEVAKLGDFNVSPVWNGLGKKIMALDTGHPLGERSLQLTRCPEWLAGYNLNKNFPFNSVFRGALQVDLDKEQMSLKITVPCINTVNDLYNVRKLPCFRLVFSFGFVPDLVCVTDSNYRHYATENGVMEGVSRSTTTEWFSTSAIIESQTIEIDLSAIVKIADTTSVTFVASAGIQFGNYSIGSAVEAVKNACCGKIIQVK